KVSEREQEQMREKLMGWKQGSGTASTYNRRFIDEETDKASIRLQEILSRRGGGNINDK
ncbi:site-specific integrase, partial [Escherichia coli]|nr:site-specific integrase [Escherichia coli]